MNPRLFWPIMLIVAGVLFLLDNLGILPGNAWGWIWPLALILAGLNVLLRRRPGAMAAEDATSIAIPLEGAARARLEVKHGAGRLDVEAGTDPALLAAGTFTSGVQQHVQRQGDRLEVTLQAEPRDWSEWMWPWNWMGPGGGLNWSLRLNPDVPLSLKFDTGASQSRLDLSRLKVADLEINTGASSTEVALPAQAGHTRAKISSGAASVKVSIPSGVAARIRGHVGAGAFNVDQGRFPRRGETYESADYESAANKVELTVESGAGEVSVR